MTEVLRGDIYPLLLITPVRVRGEDYFLYRVDKTKLLENPTQSFANHCNLFLVK